MNIGALDIASIIGYATHDMAGSYDLLKHGDMISDDKSYREYNLYWFLHDLHAAYSFDVFAVELAAGQHKNALIVMSQLRGVVNLFAAHNGIEIISYPPKTIKKWFTGNGNAGKPEMIEEYTRRTGLIPQDDNAADAYAIYQMAKEKL